MEDDPIFQTLYFVVRNFIILPQKPKSHRRDISISLRARARAMVGIGIKLCNFAAKRENDCQKQLNNVIKRRVSPLLRNSKISITLISKLRTWWIYRLLPKFRRSGTAHISRAIPLHQKQLA